MSNMEQYYSQAGFKVATDWGPQFAAATEADVVVVVDVLSFSTSVTVAVTRDMNVYPFAWKDERAVAYAHQMDAVLAVGRLESLKSGCKYPSLSPHLLSTCSYYPRLVLPSPNGSQICSELQKKGTSVVIGCLRNASAVSSYLSRELNSDRTVALVAAGERWNTDNSLRPSLEDNLGVGAILSRLELHFGHLFSPESHQAAATYNALQSRCPGLIHDSVSGVELRERGFVDDVSIAVEVDVSDVVPVLSLGGAFEYDRD